MNAPNPGSPSTTVRTADRMQDIAPFRVMEVLARAKALEAEGRDIVHMEIGEPDFDTAGPIVEAGRAALSRGETHYVQAAGIPPLREAISRFYGDRYGLDIAPSRIVVTPGASGALQLVLAVLVNPGDEVLMADPSYPCNRHFVRASEGRARGVAVGGETDFQLTAALAEAAWSERTTAVMLASPANPTGTLVPDAEMERITALCRERGAHLIVDEIYHGLTYGFDAGTALRYSPDTFVINSFSKYFGMTGWRLGWIVAPEATVPVIDRLAQNLFLCAPSMSQHAAVAAFTPEATAIFEDRRRQFQARRDLLVPSLREIGFEIPAEPRGAFYVYANCSRLTDDSQALALRVLEEAGVAITPGLDFGHNHPERYIRFAYTTGLGRIEEGIRRLRALCGQKA